MTRSKEEIINKTVEDLFFNRFIFLFNFSFLSIEKQKFFDSI